MPQARQIPMQPDNVIPLTPARGGTAELVAVDPVDAVLGAWSSDQARADVEPIAVTARICRLAHVLQQCMERASSTYGLDWGQFLVLAALRGAGPPFRMLPRDLHRLLLLSPAAVTNRLCRLEAKGYIERTSDQTDRRNMPVVLTALGLNMLDRAMAACVQKGHDLFGGADLHSVDIALREMRDVLAAYEDLVPRRRGHESPRFDYCPWSAPAVPGPDARDKFVHTNMWPTSDSELEELQRDLARLAKDAPPWQWPRRSEPAIGGVFVSLPTTRTAGAPRNIAWAGAVVMKNHTLLATATCTRRLTRPYHPGYLAVAVGPILEDVVHALPMRPDVVIVNAAGRDHVRGAGLAIQLGSALGIATIGITYRTDIGVAAEPGARRGDACPVHLDGEVVGYQIRTHERSNTIVAHAGWLTTPEMARDVAVRTTAELRLPEPVHRARQLSRRLRSEYERIASAGLYDGIHS
jgi:deoxyribonuclease V